MSLREVTGQRKDKPALVYTQVVKFEGEEAESQLQRWKYSERSIWATNRWSLKRKSIVRKHNLENYECSVSRKKGCTCPAKLRIRWPSHNQEIIVETTGQHSDHESTLPAILSPKVKQVVRQKVKEGKTAKLIQQEMTSMESIQSVPKLQQIQNFMSYQKRGDTTPVTIEHLMEYAASKMDMPEDENQVYVPSFRTRKVTVLHEFCLVWSTKKLKRFQNGSRFINVDSTYKLNWNGYPVMVAGFSDANKSFFLSHVALASNENSWCYEVFCRAIAEGGFRPEVVMADGDQSISAAARSVWPEAKRAMCFFHVMQNLRKKMRELGLSRETKREIYLNVKRLQLATTEVEFKEAARALMEYWALKYIAQEAIRIDFISYFRASWVESSLNGWYEGFSAYPSTNNGLESWNRVIKDCSTLRKLLLLRPFLRAAERMIENCSKCPDHQNIAAVPPIRHDLYRDAHVLGEEHRPLYRRNNVFVMPSAKVTDQDIVQHYDLLNGGLYLVNWEHYLELKSLFYIISPSPNWPRYFSCNCFVGAKKGLCKHALLIMRKEGRIEFPSHATADPLGRKRKRGRPSQG